MPATTRVVRTQWRQGGEGLQTFVVALFSRAISARATRALYDRDGLPILGIQRTKPVVWHEFGLREPQKGSLHTFGLDQNQKARRERREFSRAASKVEATVTKGLQ